MYSGEKVTKELDTILLATRRGAAWRKKKNRICPEVTWPLTHPGPLYQHLLANAGKYKMSEGES